MTSLMFALPRYRIKRASVLSPIMVVCQMHRGTCKLDKMSSLWVRKVTPASMKTRHWTFSSTECALPADRTADWKDTIGIGQQSLFGQCGSGVGPQVCDELCMARPSVPLLPMPPALKAVPASCIQKGLFLGHFRVSQLKVTAR